VRTVAGVTPVAAVLPLLTTTGPDFFCISR
jgi:hypothetical protein